MKHYSHRSMNVTKWFAVALAALGLTVGLARAAAPAIGIDVGNGVWTDGGENNATGLQITATSFGTIGRGGGQQTVTVDGITLTFNPGGAETVSSWADYNCILDNNSGRYSDAVPWTLSGLTPGGLYNLAFLSADPSQPGKFTVDGVGTATSDADGDGNFEDLAANGAGVISGNWDVWSPGVCALHGPSG